MMPKPAQLRRLSVPQTIALVMGAVLALWAVTVVLVYAQSTGDKLTWGTDYATWPLASGDLLSPSHAGRFYRVYGNTRETAKVFRFNGERLRYRDGTGTAKFPSGAVLAMETFDRTADNKLGAKGPIFFMRKESAGYDPDGGDWRYGMMDTKGVALADGKDGHSTECRNCHAAAKDRDFVFAKDR